MPAAHGRTDAGVSVSAKVIDDLLAAPQRYQFVQAVRLLLDWLEQHGVPREHALQHCLRFQNSLSMNFPASQIEALTIDAGAASYLLNDSQPVAADVPTLLTALRERRLHHIHITPAFMGLLGHTGTLPDHYSERIAAHQHQQQDEAPRAFLDIFSNRVLTQFYQAWEKYRIDQRGSDQFLPLLLALANAARAQDNGGDVLPGDIHRHVIGYYAGLLQQRPMSAVAMQRILSDYFRVPIVIDESVGHMNVMAASEQTALGALPAVLGDGATLGPRLWRPDLRARLRIGPLDKATLRLFLPGAPAATALHALLRMLGISLVTYEIRLVLHAGDVMGVRLGDAHAATQGGLGWGSFLRDGTESRDRPDMHYDLRVMAPLPPVATKK